MAISILTDIRKETGADERSVAKRLIGEHVRGAAGVAIDAALRRRGIEPGAAASLYPAKDSKKPAESK